MGSDTAEWGRAKSWLCDLLWTAPSAEAFLQITPGPPKIMGVS